MHTWMKLHHQKGWAGSHTAFLKHHSCHQPLLPEQQSQQNLTQASYSGPCKLHTLQKHLPYSYVSAGLERQGDGQWATAMSKGLMQRCSAGKVPLLAVG